MLEQMEYRVAAHWLAGHNPFVAPEGINDIEFSAPVEFHGQGGMWTPEYFLLAAVSSCFIATFRAIAEFSKFEPLSLDVTAEGRLERNKGGYEFTHVVVKPKLTIRDESERLRANRLLEKTESSCIVARALKCEVMMEPIIELPWTVTPVNLQAGEQNHIA